MRESLGQRVMKWLGPARFRACPAIVIVSLGATVSACSLISLDGLQGGDSSSGATSTGTGSGAAGSTSGPTTGASQTTSTSHATTGTSTATTTGGCGEFCTGEVSPDACADFDGSPHGIDESWTRYLDLGPAANTATIDADSTEFMSCPSSAKLDISVGDTTRPVWVQLQRDIPQSSWKAVRFGGEVKRTGPGGVAPGGAVFEVEYQADDTHWCQAYIQLFDDSSPIAYFFIQLQDGSGSEFLGGVDIDLSGPTAGVWTPIAARFDWGSVPAKVDLTVASHQTSFPLPGICATQPSHPVSGEWGVTYDTHSQTLFVDNLTADVE